MSRDSLESRRSKVDQPGRSSGRFLTKPVPTRLTVMVRTKESHRLMTGFSTDFFAEPAAVVTLAAT